MHVYQNRYYKSYKGDMPLTKFKFGNKSETLLRIQSQTKLSKVLDQLVCEKKEWDDRPKEVLNSTIAYTHT